MLREPQNSRATAPPTLLVVGADDDAKGIAQPAS